MGKKKRLRREKKRYAEITPVTLTENEIASVLDAARFLQENMQYGDDWTDTVRDLHNIVSRATKEI